jgi:hypothetical protein
VWLDELQRYLDGDHGVTGGAVRALLNAPYPAVIIGTLWPDRYTAYTTLPVPGGPDPHAREREVLDLAAVIRIAPDFSPAEQNRARAATARDPRLLVALDTTGYGLTQTLAAAPQLVARWEDAQTASPYAWAVLTAALDAARLGARAPLSAEFLRAAAAGYCTSAQEAEAPDNWFERALAYATKKLHGTVAALSPAGAGMGQVAGYTAADYLIQQASRERRYERVPASTWDASLSHVRDPADTTRLAGSARSRLLYRYAMPLYRHAADVGETWAARLLAQLLADRGDPDGAAQILRARRDLDQLRTRADAGDGDAAWELTGLPQQRGDLDGLRARADAGDRAAAGRLADLPEERGDLDGAARLLRAQADAGDRFAAGRLANLLQQQGDLDGLRARADAGDGEAAWRLAGLLEEHGDLDGTVQVLRALADAGDREAADWLARLLSQAGDLDQLRARADAGDREAARRLAGRLSQAGDLDQLRARAQAGDGEAAWRLAGLLEEHGDLDGAVQVLRALADAGNETAAWRLAGLLEEHGDLDGTVQVLRALADAGDSAAAGQLAGLLSQAGDLDGLRALADAGDAYAAGWLANLLQHRGDLDGLRARVDAGDMWAAERLLSLLINQGRREEAEQLRRFGLNPDGSIARP